MIEEDVRVSEQSGMGARWIAWITIAAAALYVVLPGPAQRSPFSGLALSGLATMVFCVLLVIAVFVTLFVPARRAHVVWAIAILVFCAIKIPIAKPLVATGWRGEYFTAKRAKQGFLPFEKAWFQTRAVRPATYRVEPAIDFKRATFGLSFLNELPLADDPRLRRDIEQPLVARWTGYTTVPTERGLSLTISGRGRFAIFIDRARALEVRDPASSAFSTPLAAGNHVIEIIYTKPANVEPEAHVAISEAVTAVPANAAANALSARNARLINLIGLLVLLCVAGMLVDTYWPLRSLLFEDLWASPERVVTFLIVAVLVLRAVTTTVPDRHLTHLLTIGDDPLSYETYARLIERNGLLMVNDAGHGEPYYFYPFYSYALAAAHVVFGDDFVTVVLFNHLCAAAALLLLYMLMRKRLHPVSLTVAMLALTLFVSRYVMQFANTGFTDNLFNPIAIGVVIATAATLERRSINVAFFAGLLAAIGAATRPTLMTYPPFLCIAILATRDFGSMGRRLRACAAAGMGFLLAIAPFTIRNWIVAKKFVLLVSSVGVLSYFMYAPEEPRPHDIVNDRLPSGPEATVLAIRLFASRPFHFAWVEIRKILFTLGFTSLGPPDDISPRWFFILTFLFLFALWARRIDRPLTAAMIAFCTSHVVAVVIGIPWTYGYKTILIFTLITFAGAAFLMRRVAEVDPEKPRAAIPPHPTVSVIVPDAVLAAGYDGEVVVAATVQEGIARASGDVVAVWSAGFGMTELSKLLAYIDHYDIVFAARDTYRPLAEVRRSRVLAAAITLMYGGRRITDAGSGAWVARRAAAATIAPVLNGPATEVTANAIIMALRHHYRTVQVPIHYVPAAVRTVSLSNLGSLLHAIRVRTAE
jgi:hypothetical protein